jgi:hypothetical protein
MIVLMMLLLLLLLLSLLLLFSTGEGKLGARGASRGAESWDDYGMGLSLNHNHNDKTMPIVVRLFVCPM